MLWLVHPLSVVNKYTKEYVRDWASAALQLWCVKHGASEAAVSPNPHVLLHADDAQPALPTPAGLPCALPSSEGGCHHNAFCRVQCAPVDNAHLHFWSKLSGGKKNLILIF